MKKDELLAICREQESLSGELKRLLAEKQAALEQVLRTIETQNKEIVELRSENDRLRAEIEAAAAIYRAEFERLSINYRNSIEILNRSLSTNFSELEIKWRASLETELSSLAARLKAEDPSGYETMLMDWLTDFIKDLEASLSGK